jgi:hypothetical protein
MDDESITPGAISAPAPSAVATARPFRLVRYFSFVSLLGIGIVLAPLYARTFVAVDHPARGKRDAVVEKILAAFKSGRATRQQPLLSGVSP